jgi:hypothetical protein
MSTVTLDQAIDAAMQLPPEQQEMLVEILQRRRIEARRREIAQYVEAARAAFHAGELKPQPVEVIIRELHESLGDDE